MFGNLDLFLKAIEEHMLKFGVFGNFSQLTPIN